MLLTTSRTRWCQHSRQSSAPTGPPPGTSNGATIPWASMSAQTAPRKAPAGRRRRWVWSSASTSPPSRIRNASRASPSARASPARVLQPTTHTRSPSTIPAHAWTRNRGLLKREVRWSSTRPLFAWRLSGVKWFSAYSNADLRRSSSRAARSVGAVACHSDQLTKSRRPFAAAQVRQAGAQFSLTWAGPPSCGGTSATACQARPLVPSRGAEQNAQHEPNSASSALRFQRCENLRAGASARATASRNGTVSNTACPHAVQNCFRPPTSQRDESGPAVA